MAATCAGGTATIDMMLRIVRDGSRRRGRFGDLRAALSTGFASPLEPLPRPFAARIGNHPFNAGGDRREDGGDDQRNRRRSGKLADCAGLSATGRTAVSKRNGVHSGSLFHEARPGACKVAALADGYACRRSGHRGGILRLRRISRGRFARWRVSPQEMRSQKTAARGSGIVSNGANRVEYERNRSGRLWTAQVP